MSTATYARSSYCVVALRPEIAIVVPGVPNVADAIVPSSVDTIQSPVFVNVPAVCP